jgi:hypothetical protein
MVDINRRIKFKVWRGAALDPMQDVWSKGARRGTVMINVSPKLKKANVLLLDEGGVRGQIETDAPKLPELIAAVMRTWEDHPLGESFAIIMNKKERGDVAPRPLPPPPDPVGDGLLYAHALQSHHQLIGLTEIAEGAGRLEVPIVEY